MSHPALKTKYRGYNIASLYAGKESQVNGSKSNREGNLFRTFCRLLYRYNEDAVVEVKIADSYGNVTTQRAEGSLWINAEKE